MLPIMMRIYIHCGIISSGGAMMIANIKQSGDGYNILTMK